MEVGKGVQRSNDGLAGCKEEVYVEPRLMQLLNVRE